MVTTYSYSHVLTLNLFIMINSFRWQVTHIHCSEKILTFTCELNNSNIVSLSNNSHHDLSYDFMILNEHISLGGGTLSLLYSSMYTSSI
jgi:hypothetical protein